jgi:membrane glycosyltransferase
MPPATVAIRSSTAIALCIRNEDVRSVTANLDRMLEGLEAAGVADRFHSYVLSDTDDEATAAIEAATFAARSNRGANRIAVQYRRRLNNVGFKAGNIRDFLSNWGQHHEFMLVLDADSVMSAEAILRLVRIMQANPRLGILQSLTNGLPPVSAFARVFQFGMRLGMRSYTIGGAWWQADCGPYWGHNALIRIAPFTEHCELPQLPGSGALSGCILSHDQVEAVLMRRAGFEVRVLPDATGSYEENPPSLVEFVRRDLRWCLGNMQYLHLLALPGLKTVSRIQLLIAILMFAGSLAWMAFAALGALRVGLAADPLSTFDPIVGSVLFACVMGMVFAPKIATVADLLLDSNARRSFGGGRRIVLGAVGEVVFSTLLSPVMAIAHSKFIAGLPFGRRATWGTQHRGTHRVCLREALHRFWPQTLAGGVFLVWVGGYAAAPLWSVLPLALGPLLVVPFTIFTASARGTRLFEATGLWRVPEEIRPSIARAPGLQAVRDMHDAAPMTPTGVGDSLASLATSTAE